MIASQVDAQAEEGRTRRVTRAEVAQQKIAELRKQRGALGKRRAAKKDDEDDLVDGAISLRS